ncbi:YdcF family protein [Patescibacteria group bacterium]|nr:YdcF family protein [Patescibacteria group bacterium]
MFKKILRIIYIMMVLIAGFFIISNLWIGHFAKDLVVTNVEELPQADAIIILGAYVRPDGALSYILQDRLDTGLFLYEQQKATKILVTGDHGQTEYNEVQAMKNYLLDHGVPEQDIFMDHAGFDTYDSIYRARDIFLIENAIIVTQNFHLPRAVYIADRLGLKVSGYQANLVYPWYYQVALRDLFARSKAFLDVEIFKAKPKYLGDTIPITGDGRSTQD